jgi:hypothetical protein
MKMQEEKKEYTRIRGIFSMREGKKTNIFKPGDKVVAFASQLGNMNDWEETKEPSLVDKAVSSVKSGMAHIQRTRAGSGEDIVKRSLELRPAKKSNNKWNVVDTETKEAVNSAPLERADAQALLDSIVDEQESK